MAGPGGKERRRIIPPTINKTTGEPSWRYRRIVAFAVIIYCMVMLWTLRNNMDSALNYALAIAHAWLLGIMALIYTGFATVQDLMAMFVAWSGRPYAAQAGSVETVTTQKTTIEPDPNATDPTTTPPTGFAQ